LVNFKINLYINDDLKLTKKGNKLLFVYL